MTPFWTLSRVAAALSGERPAAAARARMAPRGDAFPRGDAPLLRVWTDTRTCNAGDLFVALRGERFDAHDYLEEAVKAGAAAVVVADVRRASGLGVPVFACPDTTHALGQLGRYRREVWGGPVVAIGGSNGKTSTKELVRAALGARLEVHATQGNLNNQIGVPQTLLAIPDHADIAVVEVGTNMPGEIALLREIVQPSIAVVTAIEEEHLEGFGDLAGVLREEASLLDGVGVAVVPRHETDLVTAAHARARRVLAVGRDDASTGQRGVERAWLAADGSGRFVADGIEVTVPLRGEHNLRNAMLALAVARECGISTADAARGIAALDVAATPAMRSAVESLGDALLVNDAYNANPGSMRAAIALLAAVAGARPRVIVLGTMRELGAHSDAAHRDIARAAAGSGASLVAGVGEFAPALRAVATGDPRVVTGETLDDIWAPLAARMAPNAAILLKGSRGMRMERLIPRLREWASETPSPYRTG